MHYKADKTFREIHACILGKVTLKALRLCLGNVKHRETFAGCRAWRCTVVQSSFIRANMAPVLAYWDIRGLAQPIRLLLEYSGTKFEDKYYVCGEAPGYDKSCWFDVKFSLGLDFPNLPYYIDGDVKLTESSAILRHVARKNDLAGSTEEERYRADLMEYTIDSFRMGFVRLCYGADFDNSKAKYLEALPDKLKLFSDFLGSRKWFAGDNLTYPDFIAYEIFDQVLLLSPTCLDAFPNLKQFQKQFEELEPIKAYLASPRCIKKRLNNRMAKFGSGVE